MSIKENEVSETESDLNLLSRYRSALMGIAALAYPLFSRVAPYGRFDPDRQAEGFVKRTGFFGVDIFPMLSGIGLVYSMQKKPKVLTFYGRRLKRIILPLFQ